MAKSAPELGVSRKPILLLATAQQDHCSEGERTGDGNGRLTFLAVTVSVLENFANVRCFSRTPKKREVMSLVVESPGYMACKELLLAVTIAAQQLIVCADTLWRPMEGL